MRFEGPGRRVGCGQSEGQAGWQAGRLAGGQKREGLTDEGSRLDKQPGAKCVVEGSGALSGELKMLPLVFANGHVGGTVDEDVGRLEHGV